MHIYSTYVLLNNMKNNLLLMFSDNNLQRLGQPTGEIRKFRPLLCSIFPNNNIMIPLPGESPRPPAPLMVLIFVLFNNTQKRTNAKRYF